MNDDFHRYGALRESYAFEYAVKEGDRQECQQPDPGLLYV